MLATIKPSQYTCDFFYCNLKMLLKKVIYFILLPVILLIAGYTFQDKKIGKGSARFTEYELVKDWPQLPANYRLGNPTGIGIDSNQNIFVFHRTNREWPLFGSMPQDKISS